MSESELELFLPHVRVSLPFTWRLSRHTQALLKIIKEEYTKVLTEEQAKFMLIRAIQMGYKNGLYSLTESEIVSKSLRMLK